MVITERYIEKQIAEGAFKITPDMVFSPSATYLWFFKKVVKANGYKTNRSLCSAIDREMKKESLKGLPLNTEIALYFRCAICGKLHRVTTTVAALKQNRKDCFHVIGTSWGKDAVPVCEECKDVPEKEFAHKLSRFKKAPFKYQRTGFYGSKYIKRYLYGEYLTPMIALDDDIPPTRIYCTSADGKQTRIIADCVVFVDGTYKCTKRYQEELDEKRRREEEKAARKRAEQEAKRKEWERRANLTPTERYIEDVCQPVDNYMFRGNDDIVRYVMNAEGVDEEKLRQHNALMIYKDFVKTIYWRVFSSRIKYRDNYKCVLCGSPMNLRAHHTTYEHKGVEVFHAEDVVCLCEKCHNNLHQ